MMTKLLTALLCLAACGRATEPTTDRVEPGPAEATSAQPPLIPPEPSIYPLGTQLTAASGKPIGLDTWRGSPVLVAMFYASCPVACPVLVQEIKLALEESGRADARVLLISFDPARDTPEKLRGVIERHRLDARWAVASASERDARELAAVLGIKYRKVENGEFYHGATIVLLDDEGRPIARTDTPGERAPLVNGLQRQRAARPASIVGASDGSDSNAAAHALASSR